LHIGDFEESLVRKINRVAGAAHALILHCSRRGLTGRCALDGDCPAAVWVTIGLGTHQAVWEGNNILTVAIAGDATCSQTGLVICDIAFARRARRANAA
jgi:hypothetical protein